MATVVGTSCAVSTGWSDGVPWVGSTGWSGDAAVWSVGGLCEGSSDGTGGSTDGAGGASGWSAIEGGWLFTYLHQLW